MSQNIQKYQDAIKRGDQFNEQERWDDAVAAFKVALSEYKNMPEVYVGLAEACIGRKQYDRALDCYKLAVKTSNGKLKYLSKIPDLQERMGRLHEAARTYMALGEIYFKNQETDEAISNWQRAIRLDADLLGAHQRLALAFQRQQNDRAAVREYLAIARILNSQGKKENALKICAAAARLDPDNTDVPAAIELITKGAAAFDLPEEEEDEPAVPEKAQPDEEQSSMFVAVRQAADHLEAKGAVVKRQTGDLTKVPAERGLELAREDLSLEMFSDDDSDAFSQDGMLKLERDALIGQALHYQDREDTSKAIDCYEKAVAGGLELEAAWFMLGALYLKNGQEVAAFRAFEKAGKDDRYTEAIRDILSE